MSSLTDSLPTFVRLFPNFQTQCQTLFTMLTPIAGVLLVSGLVGTLHHSTTPRAMLRPIITTFLIVMAIAMWGKWANAATDAMDTVIEQMDARPQAAAQKYVDILVAKENPKEKNGWFGLPSAAQMYEAVLWAILSLVGIIAQFIIWAAYILQQFLVGLAYAFAPVFLGFLALRSTGNIAAKYIMGVVGIVAWPLGWAAASIGTRNLIDVATEQGLVTVGNVYSLQTIMAAAIIGGWIILTTLIAPVVIQFAVASGAQIGSALLGGAITAGTAALSAGATSAATLGTAGVGTAGAVAGAAAAAGGSVAGSAMQGGGPPLNGSTISQLARPWWSMPTSSNSGAENGSNAASEKSSGETQTPPASGGSSAPAAESPEPRSPQPVAPRFDPTDPANNRMVDELIQRSREEDQNS
jgi:hypothetical protein